MRILKQSHCAEKLKKGRPSGLFETSVCCKISKKNLKMDPLATKKSKKNLREDPVILFGFVAYVKNIVHERGDPLH